MRGELWTDAEKELLGSDMPLSELAAALPHRTIGALRSARSLYFPVRRNKRRKISAAKPKKESVAVPWSAEEVELLKTDKTAKAILPLLHESRTAWSVSHTRHKLGLAVPRIGRPTLSPTSFPGIDWALSDNRIHKATGLSRQTVAKLRRLALGGVVDG